MATLAVPHPPTRRKAFSLQRVGEAAGRYTFALLFSVLATFPLVWLVYSSLKTRQEIFADVFAWPQSFNISNYVRIWTTGNFSHYYANSILVTTVSVLGILAMATMAGYVFARLRFPLREPLFYFFLAGMMIPVQVTLIPNFVRLRDLGLLDTYWAMILPYIAFQLSVSMFIMRSFFEGIPVELEDAARMDGCSTAGIFWRIMLPLARPAIGTVIIYNFFLVWNELIFALTFTNSPTYRTIPLGLMDFVGQFDTDLGFTFAALSSATVPLLIVYFFAQKQIIKGLTAGAIKG
jgi:raffinose/stachyose/melibiose transport system permease protein